MGFNSGFKGLNKNTLKSIFLKRAPYVFFVVRKAQRDEGGGRILLGDSTSGTAVVVS